MRDNKAANASRRKFLKSTAVGAALAAVPDCLSKQASADASSDKKAGSNDAVSTDRKGAYTWNLSRPKPALPLSYFWTWDHRTNFMLDDPGMLNYGCNNEYLKRPETYIEDYRRLIDLSAGLGIKGVMIWGFIRDSHGGIESAKRVADYAASKGVDIIPGMGTTCYGGAYYEGEHPYNLDTFARNHPDAGMINAKGEVEPRGACPLSPEYLDWLKKSMQWLFKEFRIGGVNLENGDFWVCHDPRCNAHKDAWPKTDPDFFRLQALSYKPGLEAVADKLKDKQLICATYTGFLPGSSPTGQDDFMPYMMCDKPAMIDMLPEDGILQWTITGMLLQKPLPLTAYLDDGAPSAVFDNPNWPKGLRPPNKRSTGYMHQGNGFNQWGRPFLRRYDQVVSSIKESCLRSYQSGLEGVGIYGEVTPCHIPWALNYLAFSHFTHWPEDSMREFGRKTLGQVFGDEKEGEMFAELFAHWDAGTITDSQAKDIKNRTSGLRRSVATGSDLEKWRFWNWLSAVVSGYNESQTVSLF